MLLLWLKALHIISVVCWFAGLFYLPRLFVYHASTIDSISHDRFVIMERRLYRGIMTPALIATVFFGGWMLLLNPAYYLGSLWFQVKVVLVLLLLAYHGFCGHYLKQFRDNRNMHSHVFYRYFNEVPTVLLIAIVILAVVRPG